MDKRYLKAEAGKKITLTFTVISDPPLADDTKHTLYQSDGILASERFEVENNCITFNNLKVEDSGRYTISCLDNEGKKVQETLELEVTPPTHSLSLSIFIGLLV